MIEGVVADYVQAFKEGDWEAMASFMHPEALKDFKDTLTPLFRLAEDEGITAASDFIAKLYGTPDVDSALALEPSFPGAPQRPTV